MKAQEGIMEKLSKEDLIEIIISLEKELFSKQQYAEMYNKYDESLCNTKVALDKMRLILKEMI